MVPPGKHSRDEGSGSCFFLWEYICAPLVLVNGDDCGSHGDLERRGAQRCSEPWSTCKYQCWSQQSLHDLGGRVHWAAHVLMPYQVPSGQRVEKTVPSWAEFQLCLVLPAHLWCQWEQCRLGRGGLEMAGLSEAVAGLCLGFSLHKCEKGKIRAKWESQHCITIMLHWRYVQLWLVKGRKGVTLLLASSVCVTMRGSVYMLLAWMLLRNYVVQMPKEESQIVLFPFSLRDSFWTGMILHQ